MIIVDQDKKKLQKKASTLVEALPYLKKYAGDIFVIKYGGHAMGDDTLARQFAEDITLLKQVGIHPVIIHGGGPQIGKMLERLSIKTEFIDGLRVTCKATIEVAEMVLCGSICKSIVGDIQAAGGRAIGLSGKDDGMVMARKMERKKADPDSNIEKVIDLGFVGDPIEINTRIVEQAIEGGVIPVISPIAAGLDEHTYNVNADTMAGAIAGALDARRFFLLTDVPGVLNKDGEMLTELDREEINALVEEGTISGGMLPKVETCLKAAEKGVNGAVILDGRVKHAILLEIFTERGAGTLIRA
ncbi:MULTISPECIES: acetylglutamate kinase [Kordiimonas]|uniref:acetylglutamate kinase n=1 Tax=Kordiimonas TaxID=288021 RepID=UPI001FF5CE50|nr:MULTISPECIES: acetylglutamate kinase [Kordiimonas]MCK0069187.1 acetylglutamate kinase [Kordiimonas laminariae]UTW58520.1 acetylglutamate kinase [Kordiimonas sp. SCSIO 12603]